VYRWRRSHSHRRRNYLTCVLATQKVIPDWGLFASPFNPVNCLAMPFIVIMAERHPLDNPIKNQPEVTPTAACSKVGSVISSRMTNQFRLPVNANFTICCTFIPFRLPA
jgi:hypothetical protein